MNVNIVAKLLDGTVIFNCTKTFMPEENHMSVNNVYLHTTNTVSGYILGRDPVLELVGCQSLLDPTILKSDTQIFTEDLFLYKSFKSKWHYFLTKCYRLLATHAHLVVEVASRDTRLDPEGWLQENYVYRLSSSLLAHVLLSFGIPGEAVLFFNSLLGCIHNHWGWRMKPWWLAHGNSNKGYSCCFFFFFTLSSTHDGLNRMRDGHLMTHKYQQDISVKFYFLKDKQLDAPFIQGFYTIHTNEPGNHKRNETPPELWH